MLHFDIHVTDPDGNKSAVRRVDVEVVNVLGGPHILPNAPGSLDRKHLAENQLGVDTGISFVVVSDNADNTPISYTVTAETTDIDPSNFSISPISGWGHRFALEKYEIVGDGDGTNNWFNLKLKDGYAADYEGFGHHDSRELRFSIILTSPDGSTRAQEVRIQLVNIGNEVAPTLFVTRKFGAVTENVMGANTLASFRLSDPDTAISTTRTPADTTDIDPSRFNIAVRDGTHADFAKMFEVAWDDTYNRWTVKLKPGMSVDYDDAGLPADKRILLEVNVTDPDGNVSSLLGLGVDVRDAIAPVLGEPQGTGSIIENAVGADTGITFTLTDADTPISATATDGTTDIDPNSFTITAGTGTNAKFAGLFELAKTNIADTWKLKLKPGVSIDHEDTLLTNKTIQLAVQITDSSGEVSAIRNVDISVINDTTAPILGAPQGTGAIAEGINGADTGISFMVSDGMTPISSTKTADNPNDIDPNSFSVTERAGTNAKFAALFELAREDDASNIWTLKLEDTENISYADPDLAADKTIRLTIQITDPRATHRQHPAKLISAWWMAVRKVRFWARPKALVQ